MEENKITQFPTTTTNDNENNKIDNNNNQGNQQGGFGGKIFYMIVLYMIFSNIVPMFKVFNPIKNILTHRDELKFNIYASEDSLSSKSQVEKLPSLSDFESFYDVIGELDSVSFNITLPNLKIGYEENDLKRKNLYLYVVGTTLNNKKAKEINNMFNKHPLFSSEGLFFHKINLLKYIPNLKKKIRELEMLSTGEEFATKEVTQNTQIKISEQDISSNSENKNLTVEEKISHLYYKPEVTLYVTTSAHEVEESNIAELNFLKSNQKYNPQTKTFIPPVALTDFWLMTKEFQPLMKNTTASINVKVDLRFISLMKFKFLLNFEMQNTLMEDQMGLESSKDVIVELLKTNSTNYLILLFTVQSLHMIFSFMGFASDISYHKNLDRLDGLYTKIYFVRLFHYLVAVIYYYIEDVSKLIYFELIISLAIELWKFRKIFITKCSLKFPFVSFENRIKYEATKSSTLEEDAIRLTSKVLFIPLAVGYLVYRIYYYQSYIYLHPFRFIIEYFFFLLNIFGFVLMTPQIYINFKLKSVEHMPIKALAFKFLNTIIDDIFAFALDTPTLHRISVFKDDVIFVVFLVQLVIYRKNKRVDEVESYNKSGLTESKSDNLLSENKEEDDQKDKASNINREQIDDKTNTKSNLEKKND
jgi:hypothetical protein